MQIRQPIANLMISIVITFSFTASAFAIDLSYDPKQDAPLLSDDSPQDKASSTNHSRLLLPGEKVSDNGTYTPEWLSNGTEQSGESEEGWNFKTPSVSLDNEPSITDKRQSVKISEQQRWKEKGKNYDNNPLNKDNYRINVEAEYTF